MKYALIIEFEKEKDCNYCPLITDEMANCSMQRTKRGECVNFINWNQQIINCPLKQIMIGEMV